MKLLKHLQSRSRLKNVEHAGQHSHAHYGYETKSSSGSTRPRPNPTAMYPEALLEELLSHVCAHARDDTYVAYEESMIDGGCMLCDMRDLSQCALVNRQWSEAAQNVL